MEDRPLSLLEWAYKEIKKMIFTGKLKPNDKIIVTQLAEQLNISPTPVKEALNRLVAEDLFITLPRRGFKVKKLTSKDIYDIMDCRIMMETFAIPLAVKNLSTHPELEKKIKNTLNQLRKAEYNDSLRSTELEKLFHGTLIELSENKRLIGIYNMLWDTGFSFYVHSSYEISSSNPPMDLHDLALEEHEKMYEYLINRDVENLTRTVKFHLERTVEFYKNIVIQNEDENDKDSE